MSRSQGFIKRAPRVDLRRPATLINSDGVASDITILDISSGGFRLATRELPRIGEFVTLRVEHQDEFPAQIRWALGNEAGAVFLAPVDHVEWNDQTERGASMTDHDPSAGEERRQQKDRRDSERRESGDRRESPRDSERRQGDRRKEDRRD